MTAECDHTLSRSDITHTFSPQRYSPHNTPAALPLLPVWASVRARPPSCAHGPVPSKGGTHAHARTHPPHMRARPPTRASARAFTSVRGAGARASRRAGLRATHRVAVVGVLPHLQRVLPPSSGGCAARWGWWSGSIGSGSITHACTCEREWGSHASVCTGWRGWRKRGEDRHAQHGKRDSREGASCGASASARKPCCTRSTTLGSLVCTTHRCELLRGDTQRSAQPAPASSATRSTQVLELGQSGRPLPLRMQRAAAEEKDAALRAAEAAREAARVRRHTSSVRNV